MSMSLHALMEALPGAGIDGSAETPISGVECDSRRVHPGALFAAVRGNREDGHRFLAQAAAAGAAAVLSAEPRRGRASGLAWVRVGEERAALARVARRFHGEPDLRLALAGVTGTKGKTTTAWLLESMIEAAGGRPGGAGTVRTRIGKETASASLTTPDAPALCALLARMLEAGCTHAVLEVSSQALDQSRVDGLKFRCAVLTNFTQDHLDYHRDMESYFQAKARLFRSLTPGETAVLPVDDAAGTRMAELTRARRITYSGEPPPSSGGARRAGIPSEIWVESAALSLSGTAAVLRTPRGPVEIRSPLLGRHNLQNLAAAAAAAHALDLPLSAVAAGAARLEQVPGRLERIEEGQPFLVLVDYAHTENALRRVLDSLRELGRGRLLCVFGCGGDRDPGKRAPMGAAAARGADLLFLTSDNPRSEDPMAILREVEAGVRRVTPARPYQVLPDRAGAIAAALREARPGDTVLIAGKGHEREQIFAERRVPFDDREIARRILKVKQL